MPNPVLVEVTRGALVESVHRGSVAVVHADGAVRLALGDVATPVYTRSALKPLQALPLVESGAADSFGVSEEELALACASHLGEPMHTERVAAWLARIGCREADLACGPHAPRHEATSREMLRRGENPTRLHNNCSGKHTGFLTLARHLNAPIAGYEKLEHPVQQAVLTSLARLSGVADPAHGIDGCAVPNFALPLTGFARALAQLAGGRTPGAERILTAMANHPELVSGTGSPCAAIMRAAEGKAVIKIGAEGVYAGMVPATGLGIAVKIDDGAMRGAETVITALLDKLGVLKTGADLVRTPVLNTRGWTVGERRPSWALSEVTLD